MSKSQLTIREAGRLVLSKLEGPTDIDEFVQQVTAIRPSRSKNPKGVILNALWEDNGNLFVRPNARVIVPLRIIMPGIQFRRVLIPEEAREGKLLFLPTFWGYLPSRTIWQIHHAPQAIRDHLVLKDDTGKDVAISHASLKVQDTESGTPPMIALKIDRWLKKHNARAGDSIIFTVESWEENHRVFHIHHEPREETQKHWEIIIQQNARLADVIFQALEDKQDNRIDIQFAISLAHVLLDGPRETPGHHWRQVIEADARMTTDNVWIRYSDDHVWGISLGFPLTPAPLPQRPTFEITEKERNQVYRFKAYYKYRKTIWREIEVLGSQTLESLDEILHDAFSYSWDHLSGFWKLVRKGQGKRFRKISLGTVYPPFYGVGDEPANDIQIADLQLRDDDRLLYVYDYGDWIQHILEFKGVGDPESGIKYPRITAQNKKRNKYCVECKEAGRKTVAQWICVTCSNETGRSIYLCDDCVSAHHEDHYVDEIIY